MDDKPRDNMDLQAGGVKLDTGKIRMDLLAPEFVEGTADILTIGSKKYDERNWEKGMRYGRVYASLMRHLWAWWRGESKDTETGRSHLLHASCCLMFLVAYESRGMTNWDDRPLKNDANKLTQEEREALLGGPFPHPLRGPAVYPLSTDRVCLLQGCVIQAPHSPHGN